MYILFLHVTSYDVKFKITGDKYMYTKIYQIHYMLKQ